MYETVSGLSVHPAPRIFVANDALPGALVEPGAFRRDLAAVTATPRHRELPTIRGAMQTNRS